VISARNLPRIDRERKSKHIRLEPDVLGRHRRSSGRSCNNQFNYPVDTQTVEAPSLPRHTLADSVVVTSHGHSEGRRRPAARRSHLPGDKLV